jgi:hypothetical protein
VDVAHELGIGVDPRHEGKIAGTDGAQDEAGGPQLHHVEGYAPARRPRTAYL